MQYGLKWKTKLGIETHEKNMPYSLIYNFDLNKDLDRTFPNVSFFKHNKEKLKTLILNFVEP